MDMEGQAEVGEVHFAGDPAQLSAQRGWCGSVKKHVHSAVAWSPGPQRRPCGMAQVARTGALTGIDAACSTASPLGRLTGRQAKITGPDLHAATSLLAGNGPGQATTAHIHRHTDADTGQARGRRRVRLRHAENSWGAELSLAASPDGRDVRWASRRQEG